MEDNDYPVNWGPNEMEYLRSLDSKVDNVNHLNHCGFGEYEDSCKYGEDETCPSLINSNVHSPSHYTQHGVECIEAIRASLGDEFESYCKGNVIKYLWRYKYKNGVEDLKKAQVYLNWMVEATEGK